MAVLNIIQLLLAVRKTPAPLCWSTAGDGVFALLWRSVASWRSTLARTCSKWRTGAATLSSQTLQSRSRTDIVSCSARPWPQVDPLNWRGLICALHPPAQIVRKSVGNTDFTQSHSLFKGLCCKPQQDSTCAGHPAEEPDQTRGIPEQLPDGQIWGRAVLRREKLSDQADQRPEETHSARGSLTLQGRLLCQVVDYRGGCWSCKEKKKSFFKIE